MLTQLAAWQVGKCYWLIPILADAKTFKQRRATWAGMH